MGAPLIYRLGAGATKHRAMMVDDPEWAGWRDLETAEPLAATWQPPPLRFYLPGETGLAGDRKGKGALPTDTDMPIVFGAVMTVVSERLASSPAGATLARYGEFLPCASPDGAFFVYHCTHVIDALDESRSDVGRTAGRIRNVYKYAFRPGTIPPGCVFRLPVGNRYLNFCTGEVDALLRQSPLQGVRTEVVPLVE
jgi:hypothetical protein